MGQRNLFDLQGRVALVTGASRGIALLPGLTDTRFASALTSNDGIGDRALEHIPVHPMAAPDGIAGTVLYLLSDASSYTTGTCVNVEGGYLTV